MFLPHRRRSVTVPLSDSLSLALRAHTYTIWQNAETASTSKKWLRKGFWHGAICQVCLHQN